MKFTDAAITDRNMNASGRAPGNVKPVTAPKIELGGADTFIAGQMKYNPIVAGVQKARTMLESNEVDVDGYNPFHNPEDLAGYPLEEFSRSGSPEETARIKREWDQSYYINRILDESGAAGVVSSVAGGAANPLYLVPFLRIGHAGRYIKSGIDAAAGEAVTEIAYQGLDLDRMRSAGESVFNVAAGAVFGSILGGVARTGQFTKQEALEIQEKLRKEFEFVGPRPADIVDTPRTARDPSPVDGAVLSLADIPTPERIKGRASRALSKITPLRVLASESANARKLGSLLGEQTVVGTSRAAIETLVKRYDGYLGKAFMEVGGQYNAYSKAGGRLSRRKFGESVVDAMRAGDSHVDPHIQAAAQKIRRELMEPVRKKAVEAGIYPADKDLAKFSEGYFPRMYNFDLISAHLDRFRFDVESYLSKEFTDFNAEDIAQAAREISQTIRHKYNGQNALSGTTEFTANALKGRKVPIPDDVLKPWLINDPDLVLRAWSHNMATQTEMTKMFGDTNLENLFKEVEDDWDEIISKASETNPAKALRLQRQKNNDIETLEALKERLMNRYKLPDNPTSGWVRAGKMARNLNVVRLLGGMTLSAMPDLARPLYQNGFRQYGKAIAALSTGSPAFKKMAKADMHRSGVALDMVLNQRLRAISELDYVPSLGRGGYVDMAENGLERLVMGTSGSKIDFGKLTLMSPWNATLKSLSFLMSQDGLIAHTMNPVKHAKKLKRAGINDDMSRRIRDQFKEFGATDGGLRTANLDEWTDLEAAELFEATLLREVDGTIISPGIMDKPLWTSSEVGKFLSQFKSFAFAATNKQLISGLNNFDGMFIQGTLMATTLGAITWSLKRRLAGYDDQEMDNKELIIRGIEYSGVVGFGSELISMGTGVANAAGLYKGDGNFRWASKGVVGSIGGPGLGLIEDLMRAPRTAFRDEPSGGDVEALRRILPYNNLFYARLAFDVLEQNTKDSLNIVE